MSYSPLITVVIPVYNAQTYISEAIESVLAQDYPNIELIIVDDGSTDDSAKIIDEYVSQNANIKCYHLSNSGSAKFPRDYAIFHSSSDIIVTLDADDLLEKGYISEMHAIMRDYNADIVFPTMSFFQDEITDIKWVLPKDTIQKNNLYNGKDLVKCTLKQWEIGCNGGMYKKNIMNNLSYPPNGQEVLMNTDEYDTRLYLINAQKVCFSEAKYYYRLGIESITRKLSEKSFEPLLTNIRIFGLIKNTFSKDSNEVRVAKRNASDILTYIHKYKENYNTFSESQKNKIEDIIGRSIKTAPIPLNNLRDFKNYIKAVIIHLVRGYHAYK